ncbi:MAG TPA: acetyltransferase [Candidatus Didemnitutus sp.]|nr:acetyltransferase [Candidatus Didemnitutus sp.]
MPRLLVLGAGGHGKVAADCAQAADKGREVIFFDDRWPGLAACGRWPVRGTCVQIGAFAQGDDRVFVAIGRAEIRLRFLHSLALAGRNVDTIVHPRSVVSAEARLEPGTLVVAGAVINAGTRVGFGCIINTVASVDHDCDLAEGVHVCPGAHLAGNVVAGAGAWIGLGSVVREGIHIGARACIGAGAVVVADVPDDVVVAGVPARPLPGKSAAG